MKYILSVDIGTTAIKGAVIGEDGTILGSATSEYVLITLPDGGVEQSIQVYESAFRSAISRAIENAGVPVSQIICLGFSATGETVVFLGKEGKVLRNVMAWMDTRSLAEAEYLTGLFSKDEILRRTGAPTFRPSFISSKILWVKNHEPELFASVEKFAFIKDYFLYRLTGRLASEDSLMCDAGCWDIQTRGYWKEVLDVLEIRENQLPEIVLPGEDLGCITPQAAEDFGLHPGTRINAGAMDQACGALGAGNNRPGIVSESTGSALVSVFISDRFTYDPSGAIPLFCAGLPGQYMFQPFSTGAIILKWYRDQFCSCEKEMEALAGVNAYTLIDKEAEKVPAGSDGLILLPYFQGSGSPIVNKRAKGVFYGLTTGHTKGHFARAIMEGLAMALRHMVEAAAPLSGEVREVRSLGGGAKSRVWCQIKADVLGVPVKVLSNSESIPCLGAAMIAGAAAGLWPSVQVAADRFVSVSETYYPIPENKAAYDTAFAQYLAVGSALNTVYK